MSLKNVAQLSVWVFFTFMTEHTLNELKKREREIVTELIALNDLIEILTKNNNCMPWYPKKDNVGDLICPVCDGTGKVTDKITHQMRECVLCFGKGAVIPKGNAKVYPMPQKDLSRIMHITKLK